MQGFIVIELDKYDPRPMWSALLEIADAHPQGWTVIGAAMVALHAFERGVLPLRRSRDVDIVVDVRTVHRNTQEFVAVLESLDFGLAGINSHGIGHRYTRGDVSIDVLAPDGVKNEAALITTAPARTVCVPGGWQALHRTEHISVQTVERTGMLPRPDLPGALLVKARAVWVDDVPEAQLVDVAFLLSLVDDPRSMRDAMKRSERGWLRKLEAEIGDREAKAWRELVDPDAERGHAAYRVLIA